MSEIRHRTRTRQHRNRNTAVYTVPVLHPKPRSLLARQAEADPVGFASLCGKIDSIAHLKREAKELSDNQREQAKKVSGN